MQLPPLQFGSVVIECPVVLAPMAGYTDGAMRTLCLEQGAGAVYTELISAEGIRRNSANTLQLLETEEQEHPVAGHLFGSDPEAMAAAAGRAEQTGRFDWIDINCGCPVKKVISRGAGAALLKDLALLGRIVEAVKKAVSLPVSVKTRIGFNQGTADHLEIARAVEQGGADMIAVHARLAKHFHSGAPDWEKLGAMKQVLNIPIIGNGGVFTPEDAQRMAEVSHVDGVMIGRGAIGNPWIFAQIRPQQNSDVVVADNGGTPSSASADSGDAVPPSITSRRRDAGQTPELVLAEVRNMMAEHLKRMVAINERKQEILCRPGRYTPEEAACIQFRPHIPYYVKGLFDKKQLLMKLAHLLTVDAIITEVDLLVEKNRKSGKDAVHAGEMQ